ncbi:MAG: hypothetical protein Q8K63_13575 [Acidimicrobiales bacterium]|nr:hypothetical protein [Acidimicrobiales bacterium]
MTRSDADLTDDQLESHVLDWLRGELPAQRIKAVETDDVQLLEQARGEVDYFDFVRRLSRLASPRPPGPASIPGSA